MIFDDFHDFLTCVTWRRVLRTTMGIDIENESLAALPLREGGGAKHSPPGGHLVTRHHIRLD